ncbi:hypothetical protein ILUMI_21008 [Ignelater luminosus]|uniref:Uncharacterized protein n=1 Tax=Ignelater luminosus TaxID=2038154 RepID=A0A8K0G4B3_IGNLU|nr:hypothetical protein ILUMI_21008 [Ignelater luminosus]
MDTWNRCFQTLLNVGGIEKEEIVQLERETTREKNDKETTEQGDITMEELRNVVQKIRNGKAPGHVRIAVEIIKALSELGCETLLNLLNHIKKEKKIPKFYRTITIGKMNTKIRLRKKAEQELKGTRCGFRKGKGPNLHSKTDNRKGSKIRKQNSPMLNGPDQSI